MDLDEGRIRAELAEFLTRASTEGGVILGRGGAILLADAPAAVHVFPPATARDAWRAWPSGKASTAMRRTGAYARRTAPGGYVRRAFGVESDDRTRYHLIIDTVAVGIDAGVDLVLVASRARTGLSPTES